MIMMNASSELGGERRWRRGPFLGRGLVLGGLVLAVVVAGCFDSGHSLGTPHAGSGGISGVGGEGSGGVLGGSGGMGGDASDSGGSGGNGSGGSGGSGSGGSGGSGAGGMNASYECSAGGDSVSCVVGESYCRISRGRGGGPGTTNGTPSCAPISAPCTATPTCDCICPPDAGHRCQMGIAGGLYSCTCQEASGAITATCDLV
jgi:hypothetical protein